MSLKASILPPEGDTHRTWKLELAVTIRIFIFKRKNILDLGYISELRKKKFINLCHLQQVIIILIV